MNLGTLSTPIFKKLRSVNFCKKRRHFLDFTGLFQSFIVVCRVLDTVSEPAGTSLVSVVPAPIVAPLPTLTGATSSQFVPIKASSSITVLCLLAPS